MANGKTDVDGSFTLEGHTAEFFTIDPKLIIYYRCNKETFSKKASIWARRDWKIPKCWNVLTLRVPRTHVSMGKSAHNTYEYGTLEMRFLNRYAQRDCPQ
ncbi:unnamed protein product [Anisakis simplex]|uniref:Transthyretin-like family protein n=1 Tax=Anisakis simplex TaxID=6269 RepID=A0A0M3JHP9_ANISI|nr:unnamed protein product [Anisakis simplex]